MGTNYYLEPEPPCATCGRGYDRLHIGKSSAGWVFALHVIPEEGINDLIDWIARWLKPGAVIRDEYGTEIAPGEMLNRIVARTCNPDGARWLHATKGPRGLARAQIGHNVIGHGAGTWDLHTGEFS